MECKSEGFVYGIHVPPGSARLFDQHKLIEEWRVPGPIRWEWVARTTVDDLPGDLMAVDITENGLLARFLGALIEGGDPVRVGQELDVEISTLEAVRQFFQEQQTE